MKRLIATLAAVLVAIGGYLWFTQYEQHKFIESIRPHVKNSSLRLTNAARYETDDGTKITYKELFEKLESDITEIDKRILEVQTIATPGNNDITEPVLEYQKASQVLLRSLLMKIRKRFALKNASEWANQAADEIRTSGPYAIEYAKKASDKSLKDLQKAMDEYKESMSDVVGTAKNVKSAYAKVAAIFPSDVLIDPATVDAIIKMNEPKQNAAGVKEQAPQDTKDQNVNSSPASSATQNEKKIAISYATAIAQSGKCEFSEDSVEIASGTIAGFEGRAIVTIYHTAGCGGGSNHGSTLVVLSSRSGKVDKIAETSAPVISELKIVNGKISAKVTAMGPNDAYCCPTMINTVLLSIQGNKLVPPLGLAQ